MAPDRSARAPQAAPAQTGSGETEAEGAESRRGERGLWVRLLCTSLSSRPFPRQEAHGWALRSLKGKCRGLDRSLQRLVPPRRLRATRSRLGKRLMN